MQDQLEWQSEALKAEQRREGERARQSPTGGATPTASPFATMTYTTSIEAWASSAKTEKPGCWLATAAEMGAARCSSGYSVPRPQILLKSA